MPRLPRTPLLAFALLAAAASTPAQSCAPRLAPMSLTPGLQGGVNVITAYDDGSGLGNAFFAGGTLSGFGGVARLTPEGWAAAGTLPSGVQALEVIPDGTGPGGRPGFYAATGNGLFRWDAQTWQPVAPAISAGLVAVTWLPAAAGGVSLHVVTSSGQFMRLDNGAWTTLATFFGSNRWTQRVLSFDEDGPSGPIPHAIYFVSNITNITRPAPLGALSTNNAVVRWDGTTFTGLPINNGIGAWFKSAAIYDDGVNGPALFVSGHGQSPLGSVVRWDTLSQTFVAPWPVSPGFGDAAYGMAVLPDGQSANADRSRLYGFSNSTGLGLSTPARPAAAWNGTSWSSISSPVGTASSLNYHFPAAAGELGLAHIPAILVANNPGTGFFAILGCPRCPADLDLDGAATIGDLFPYLDAYFARTTAADTDGSGTVTLQDLFDFLGSYFAGCRE